jgi:MFS family permease
MLGTLLIPLAVMRVRIRPAQKRPLFDQTALRELPFMLFTLGAFFGFIGIYIPFFYMPSFALQKIPGVTADFSIYTIAILNGASTVGRIVPNYVADKTGPLNMIVPCALVSAILAYCWVAVENKGGMIVFCILYGFFTGSFVSLPPTTIVTLSPRLEIVGTRMGMVFSVCGLGLLIGSPVAGAILGSGDDFLALQLFCACAIVVSAMTLYPVRVAKVCWRVVAWV